MSGRHVFGGQSASGFASATLTHMPLTPETVVRCRLVDHWFAGWIARAEHCYEVSYGPGGAYTSEGSESQGRSEGTLKINRYPGDQSNVNRRTDNTVFHAFGPLQIPFAQCIQAEGVRMTAAQYPYYYLGPNSNTALNTMMRNCGQPVTLPLIAPGGRDTYPTR